MTLSSDGIKVLESRFVAGVSDTSSLHVQSKMSRFFVPGGPGTSTVVLWEYNSCILYIDKPSGERQVGFCANEHHYLGLWNIPAQ